MQNTPAYNKLILDIFSNLQSKIQLCNSYDINNIIIDVGIGFGKTIQHNFELINRIDEFASLNYPIMIGLSRKSLLGIQNNDNNLKDIMTV
jgi:dihydropteroate synthase